MKIITSLLRRWFLARALAKKKSGSLQGEGLRLGASVSEMLGTALNRRTVVKYLAVITGWAVCLAGLPHLLLSKTQKKSEESPIPMPKGPLPKWGMAIDLDKCTGCGACMVACATENNVPFSGPLPEQRGTQIHWMNLLLQNPENENGAQKPTIIPNPCMHCEDPPCVKVCPVGATIIDEEGLVGQIYDRCIGCRYCMEACPYSVRYFNWTTPEWPETFKNFLNPDVSTRPAGVVEKCTFCVHRIRNAREEARVSGEPLGDEKVVRLTACAQACPAEAIVFGNLNEPDSTLSKLSRDPRNFRLLEHLGTQPKVFYLAKERNQT